MCISDLLLYIIHLNNISSAGCEMLFIICKPNQTKEKHLCSILSISEEYLENATVIENGTGLNDNASQMENMYDTS